jgi:predicted Zn-dependent peptidase
VLNTILGEGMSSRLFQEIREKRGLAYSVHSYVSSLSDTGSLVISAGVSPENAPMAVSATLGELDRLRNEPVSEDVLLRAKEYLKGRLLLSMEDTFSNAAWVGRQEILDGEVLSIDDVVAGIEAVQVADIREIAMRLFRTEMLLLAVVGPNEEENFEGRLAL